MLSCTSEDPHACPPPGKWKRGRGGGALSHQGCLHEVICGLLPAQGAGLGGGLAPGDGAAWSSPLPRPALSLAGRKAG